MWRALRAALLGLAAGACGGSADGPAAPAQDERVQSLLDECASAPRYEKDTSWIVPILIEKLAAGEPEPIRRAEDELALLGDEAMEELLRFVERNFSDAFASTAIENALGAAAKSRSPAARAVLWAGMDHPQEVVRTAALAGLIAGHAEAGDFDALAARLGVPLSMPEQQDLVRALFRADATRAAEATLEWIAKGEHAELWPVAAQLLLPREVGLRPELCLELQERQETLAREVRPALVAACARSGSAEGVKTLRALLADEDPLLRLATAQAAARAGLVEELVALLADPDRLVRAAAVGALADEPVIADARAEEERRERLRAALDDEASAVRAAALAGLAVRGDASALDRGLAEIDASDERMVAALLALRPALLASPELAGRALAALVERDRRESHRPLAERTATLKALGLVPLADAARLLRRIALEHRDESLQGLPAHRWIAIQAGNTGVPGRTFLAAELADETDPARRIDLLDAVATERDELARETLFERLSADRAGREALFAAARLVQLGPAERVATRIKRAALDVEDGDVRRGMWCLLWRWY